MNQEMFISEAMKYINVQPTSCLSEMAGRELRGYKVKGMDIIAPDYTCVHLTKSKPFKHTKHLDNSVRRRTRTIIQSLSEVLFSGSNQSRNELMIITNNNKIWMIKYDISSSGKSTLQHLYLGSVNGSSIVFQRESK